MVIFHYQLFQFSFRIAEGVIGVLGSEVPEDETLTHVPMWFWHRSQTEVIPCGITTWLRGLSDLDQPVSKLMTSRTSKWRNTLED